MKLKRITTNLAIILLLFTGCGNNSKDTIIKSTTVEVENYDKPLEVIEKYGFNISGEKLVKRLDFITDDKLFYYVNNNKDKHMTHLVYNSASLKKYFTLESSLFGTTEIKVSDLLSNFKENNEFFNMLSTLIKACDPTIEENLIEKILNDTDVIHNQIEYKILSNALYIKPAYGLENKEVLRTQKIEVESSTQNQDLFHKIINANHHPKLYSDIEEAKKIWGDYEEVIGDYPYEQYSDNTILCVDKIKDREANKETITGFEIYPSNTQTHIDLEEALSIAYNYINFNFINNYYTKPSVKKFKKDNNYQYLFYYVLAENAEIKNIDNFVSGKVIVIIEATNNTISLIRVIAEPSFYSERYFSGYEVEEWSYDGPLASIGIE